MNRLTERFQPITGVAVCNLFTLYRSVPAKERLTALWSTPRQSDHPCLDVSVRPLSLCQFTQSTQSGSQLDPNQSPKVDIRWHASSIGRSTEVQQLWS